MTAVRVVLVDSHQIVCKALRGFLADLAGITVVGDAGNGREALDLVAKLQPQLVLLEMSLPGLGGVEVTRRIVSQHPGVRVIVLSTLADSGHVLAALRAGASGYIYKGSQPHELELAIESVARGEMFLSPAISRPVIEAYLNGSANAIDQTEILTSRQREILQLIAEGYSTKQIAEMLKSSTKTIESHRANIMKRLGIHNLAGLVRYAVRNTFCLGSAFAAVILT